jgi:Fic family protein
MPQDNTSDNNRPYLASHPWISFHADLTGAPPSLWMLLGEAASKCEHLAGVPLRQDTANSLHQIYMAKGVLATTAIEGNTLSEAQALEAVEGHLKLPPSQEYLAQELHNIIEAVNTICAKVINGDDLTLSRTDIDTYNRTVLKDLDEEGVIPGRVRTGSVRVGNVYLGAPAGDCEFLLDQLCSWLNGPEFEAPAGQEIPFAILRAVIAHLYIAWIHPYGNGNGRTARLVEFHLLVSNGVPTPAAHLLSNHYNQTRSEYYRQLERASRSGGDVVPFIRYALQGFVDGLAAQIDMVQEQLFELTWQALIEEIITGHSPADVRRKKLANALFRQADPVPKTALKDLTPELARLYGDRTDKALSRDLNSAPLRELIEKTLGGYRARREIISGFLPLRRTSPER